MDVTIRKEGFYVDPDTKRTFFYMTRGGKPFIPHWVKSKPSDWKPIKEALAEPEKQFNSHDFEEVYKDMGIDVDKLGCIMLDLNADNLPDLPINEKDFYSSKSRFWIKGNVSKKTPHVTLLYGLLKPGPEWKEYVDKVLGSWKVDTVKIRNVGFFESNIPDEPYYCIVAHIEITPELKEGHQRLELLPHINTFPGYKAHFTLAYIKKDEANKNSVVSHLNTVLPGKQLKVVKLNYGGNKDE